MVCQYSHLIEKLLSLTYDALGLKLNGALQVCDGCARSKAKPHSIIKKTYTGASNTAESIFVDTTGPLLEILICVRYYISVVDDCSHYYWSFFTKTKSQMMNKMEELFEKMKSCGTSVK